MARILHGRSGARTWSTTRGSPPRPPARRTSTSGWVHPGPSSATSRPRECWSGSPEYGVPCAARDAPPRRSPPAGARAGRAARDRAPGRRAAAPDPDRGPVRTAPCPSRRADHVPASTTASPRRAAPTALAASSGGARRRARDGGAAPTTVRGRHRRRPLAPGLSTATHSSPPRRHEHRPRHRVRPRHRPRDRPAAARPRRPRDRRLPRRRRRPQTAGHRRRAARRRHRPRVGHRARGPAARVAHPAGLAAARRGRARTDELGAHRLRRRPPSVRVTVRSPRTVEAAAHVFADVSRRSGSCPAGSARSPTTAPAACTPTAISKAGANMVGLNLPHDLSPHGVSVVMLQPDLVATALTKGFSGDHAFIQPVQAAAGLFRAIDHAHARDLGPLPARERHLSALVTVFSTRRKPQNHHCLRLRPGVGPARTSALTSPNCQLPDVRGLTARVPKTQNLATLDEDSPVRQAALHRRRGRHEGRRLEPGSSRT